MEEKILIKSEQYNVKRICLWVLIVIFVGMMVMPVIKAVEYFDLAATSKKYYNYYDSLLDILPAEALTEMANNGNYDMYSVKLDDGSTWTCGELLDLRRYENNDWRRHRESALSLIVLGFVCSMGTGFLFASLIYLWLAKTELVITDKRVYGRTAFGKRVDLPIDSISATATSVPKGISVATSSGRISFLMIRNRNEINECVSGLLIERQDKPLTTNIVKQEIPQSNADELKKYKDLLDSGVITQEEFDAKKKQLLGL